MVEMLKIDYMSKKKINKNINNNDLYALYTD